MEARAWPLPVVLTGVSCRLVPPVAPNPQLFAQLVGNAFAIAVVGFAIAISLGKIFALRHGYRVDSNQVWGWEVGVGRWVWDMEGAVLGAVGERQRRWTVTKALEALECGCRLG